MITSVEIDGFRCFKQLRVDGLTRVNVIVGANNSGKTVLLEAIEAVVSGDHLFSMRRASLERGEVRRSQSTGNTDFELDPRHWFYGHVLTPGTSLGIRAAGDRKFSISRTIETVPPNTPSPYIPGGLRLVVEPSTPFVYALSEDGWLGATLLSRFDSFGLRLNPPVGFVTADRLSPRELAPLWTNVVLTPGEQQTVEALRLIDPSIERIAIVEGDGPIAKVLLRGAEAPVPLGTLGEGVSRIFALALHLVLTQRGFLLIDEIENGLHWSVMPKVWRFLVETALARNVQIFATTHSKDWLEGLAGLRREHPELAAQISIHRLEAGRETSVAFDASRIAEYVEMGIEAR